ncbi:hypothetical protein B0H14DRAFT_3132187 [Mycena olivaceomarginata]|nr:hypothetical protein B0H14DRAFT_3132187 [Mycena olivaceomarginata]
MAIPLQNSCTGQPHTGITTAAIAILARRRIVTIITVITSLHTRASSWANVEPPTGPVSVRFVAKRDRGPESVTTVKRSSNGALYECPASAETRETSAVSRGKGQSQHQQDEWQQTISVPGATRINTDGADPGAVRGPCAGAGVMGEKPAVPAHPAALVLSSGRQRKVPPFSTGLQGLACGAATHLTGEPGGREKRRAIGAGNMAAGAGNVAAGAEGKTAGVGNGTTGIRNDPPRHLPNPRAVRGVPEQDRGQGEVLARIDMAPAPTWRGYDVWI